VPQIQLKGAFTNSQPEMPMAVNGSRPASYIGHVVSNGTNFYFPVGAVGINIGTNLTNVNLKLQPSWAVPQTIAQQSSLAVEISQSLLSAHACSNTHRCSSLVGATTTLPDTASSLLHLAHECGDSRTTIPSLSSTTLLTSIFTGSALDNCSTKITSHGSRPITLSAHGCS